MVICNVTFIFKNGPSEISGRQPLNKGNFGEGSFWTFYSPNLFSAEAYSTCQTSMVELFANKINCWKPWIIFAKTPYLMLIRIMRILHPYLFYSCFCYVGFVYVRVSVNNSCVVWSLEIGGKVIWKEFRKVRKCKLSTNQVQSSLKLRSWYWNKAITIRNRNISSRDLCITSYTQWSSWTRCISNNCMQ